MTPPRARRAAAGRMGYASPERPPGAGDGPAQEAHVSGWVLLLSTDVLRLEQLETGIRLAGFSPRRAPDLPLARVLMSQADDAPVAVVVDLVSVAENGLAASEELAGPRPVIAIAPEQPRDLAARAERAGAVILSAKEGPEVLAGCLATLTRPTGGL